MRLMKGVKTNAHINQSLHIVMYHPASRVETIVYIKKENRSIVYSSTHDSVSQRLEKYLRGEREQASHSNSKREWRKEIPALIYTHHDFSRCTISLPSKWFPSAAPPNFKSSWLPIISLPLANFSCDSIPIFLPSHHLLPLVY